MMLNKKGISPVVAATLLIVIVVIAGAIIAVILLNMKGDICTKFGTDCSSNCNDVDLDYSIDGGDLYVTNVGRVGVYALKIGDYDCSVQLAPGESATCDVSVGEDSAVPIILGQDEDNHDVEYVCTDAEFSF
ncbi:MAG: type IV pilin [Nanoarchaeota archaeon]|nr:type IV pilin [Nanoarchaeota archaeon]